MLQFLPSTLKNFRHLCCVRVIIITIIIISYVIHIIGEICIILHYYVIKANSFMYVYTNTFVVYKDNNKITERREKKNKIKKFHLKQMPCNCTK